jgi:chromate transporter
LKARKFLFIRDVVWFTIFSFGGAQAHIAMMLKEFVKKRNYIKENELLELNALTQVLPGPSSTQTLIGIAYKVGGVPLSIITFLIWVFPSAFAMAVIAINYDLLNQKEKFDHILLFVQPIAVGTVGYAAYSLARSVLKTKVSVWLALSSVIVTLILRNAYVFPISILVGGIISSALDSPEEESEFRVRLISKINRTKIIYFLGVLVILALVGALVNQTSPFSLPIRLLENFYRNGIMVFGGGQVLVPLMFTEFVEMKQYISADQFLAGYAFQQALPGPTFSFTSFIGAITLKNFGYGTLGQILGSFLATIGINLPGFILILFFVPFWNDLKQVSRIKTSLSGINAVSVGFMIAAFIFLLSPLGFNWTSISIMTATFLLLNFTRIRIPVLIIAGILIGFFL